MNLAHEVAEKLLEIKAVQFRPSQPFIWASGLRSPIYCDNRIILSHPNVRDVVKSCLVQKSNQLGQFDYIAGVATAGIAHGMMLADSLQLPYIYVRAKAKGHGKQNLIEGQIKGNPKTLVIEDLISTGGSSIKAVEALREAGAEVSQVLSIFTYGLKKATDNFDKINCHYTALCDYDTMINVANQKKYIHSDQLATLQAWRQDPAKWSDSIN